MFNFSSNSQGKAKAKEVFTLKLEISKMLQEHASNEQEFHNLIGMYGSKLDENDKEIDSLSKENEILKEKVEMMENTSMKTFTPDALKQKIDILAKLIKFKITPGILNIFEDNSKICSFSLERWWMSYCLENDMIETLPGKEFLETFLNGQLFVIPYQSMVPLNNSSFFSNLISDEKEKILELMIDLYSNQIGKSINESLIEKIVEDLDFEVGVSFEQRCERKYEA